VLFRGRSPLLSRPAWLPSRSVGNCLKTRTRSSKRPERSQCVYKAVILINITFASPTYSIVRLPECPCASLLVSCFDTTFYRSVHPVKTRLAILLALHTPLINMIVDGMELLEDDDLARPASPSHSKVKRAVARAQLIFSFNSASLAAYASIHHTFEFAPY
jgi:hypothetical protein